VGIRKCFAEERINCGFASEEVREKPPGEVLQWSHGSNMATTSEQTCKLADLISTSQTTTASDERTFFQPLAESRSTFAPLSQDRLSRLSLLFIEEALITELNKISNF
jgi:hypothetical protein